MGSLWNLMWFKQTWDINPTGWLRQVIVDLPLSGDTAEISAVGNAKYFNSAISS